MLVVSLGSLFAHDMVANIATRRLNMPPSFVLS